MHWYTLRELDWLRATYPTTPLKELTAEFNARYGADVKERALHSAMKRYGISSGRDGRFKKGQASHNKGKHFVSGGRSAETRFKPGNRPKNWRPVGSERVNVDGYIEVKVAEPKKWELKHRIVWRNAHGDIPQDSVVLFADGNKQNLDIDNLMLVKHSQLAVMNKMRLTGYSRELTEAARAVADLRIAAKRKELEMKSKGHERGQA